MQMSIERVYKCTEVKTFASVPVKVYEPSTNEKENELSKCEITGAFCDQTLKRGDDFCTEYTSTLSDEYIFLTDEATQVFIEKKVVANERKVSFLIINMDGSSTKKRSYIHDMIKKHETCLFRLHSKQLFIVWLSPAKLISFDLAAVSSIEWLSNANISRVLTCYNMAVILERNHTNSFICLTMACSRIHENRVQKPLQFMKGFKFSHLLNVHGKIIWLAENQNKVLCFRLNQNNELEIIKEFIFAKNCVIINDLFSYKDLKLFIPIVSLSNFSDIVSGYEIVVVCLVTFDIVYVLRGQNEINIYSDSIKICSDSDGYRIRGHGTRKLADGSNIHTFSDTYLVPPLSLLEASFMTYRNQNTHKRDLKIFKQLSVKFLNT